MTNMPRQEKLYRLMCEKAPELNTLAERGKPVYPDSDKLFAMALISYRKKFGKAASTRGLIQDISEWQGLNEWAWSWDLKTVILGYYMRTAHTKCWDIMQKDWVKVT